jgi:hypothetical protein
MGKSRLGDIPYLILNFEPIVLIITIICIDGSDHGFLLTFNIIVLLPAKYEKPLLQGLNNSDFFAFFLYSELLTRAFGPCNGEQAWGPIPP